MDKQVTALSGGVSSCWWWQELLLAQPQGQRVALPSAVFFESMPWLRLLWMEPHSPTISPFIFVHCCGDFLSHSHRLHTGLLQTISGLLDHWPIPISSKKLKTRSQCIFLQFLPLPPSCNHSLIGTTSLFRLSNHPAASLRFSVEVLTTHEAEKWDWWTA